MVCLSLSTPSCSDMLSCYLKKKKKSTKKDIDSAITVMLLLGSDVLLIGLQSVSKYKEEE